jgi:hypothetical protein
MLGDIVEGLLGYAMSAVRFLPSKLSTAANAMK